MSERVETWVNAYRRAWETNEPDDIRALFTTDAEYRMTPVAAPWVGSDAIVAGWLEHADPAGSTTFSWHAVAEQDDTAVVQCITGYPSGPKVGTYENLWVIRFGPGGRARSFTDWWVGRG